VTSNPGGFNFKAVQSNVVLRWEYNPGVDSVRGLEPGRQGFNNIEGNRDFSGDHAGSFPTAPANTFLVKLSYWLNR